MSLTTCFKCGHSVSSSARECPKCYILSPHDHSGHQKKIEEKKKNEEEQRKLERLSQQRLVKIQVLADKLAKNCQEHAVCPDCSKTFSLERILGHSCDNCGCDRVVPCHRESRLSATVRRGTVDGDVVYLCDHFAVFHCKDCSAVYVNADDVDQRTRLTNGFLVDSSRLRRNTEERERTVKFYDEYETESYTVTTGFECADKEKCLIFSSARQLVPGLEISYHKKESREPKRLGFLGKIFG